MKAEHIKNGALALLAAAGGLLAQALGGWDTALQSLIFCMAVDYLTGMLVAGVFRRSGKTESGALGQPGRVSRAVQKGRGAGGRAGGRPAGPAVGLQQHCP